MIFIESMRAGPGYRFIDCRRAYYERSLQEFGYFVSLLLSVLPRAVHISGAQMQESGKARMSAPDPAPQNAPMVALSWGEVIDKITILEIKQQRLSSADAIANVERELAALNKVVADASVPAALMELKMALKAINEKLWDIENQIRAKEAQGTFDSVFIELARSVYINNDLRAKLKRAINELLNSELVEEKQYTTYAAQKSLSAV
jgi:hypothetical protein